MTEHPSDSSPSGNLGPTDFVLPVSDAWRRWRQRVNLAEYDKRWEQMEAEGQSVHAEADFVSQILVDQILVSRIAAGSDSPSGDQVVLDAGCGTGRVGVELARRGHHVVGVDNDADMLAYARLKPEPVRWELADLATMALPERFDVVVGAGNTLTFVEPANRAAVVANLGRHLKVGGQLVMGSNEVSGCRFSDVDQWCESANLVLVASYSTWDGEPFNAGGRYRVSVHQRTE